MKLGILGSTRGTHLIALYEAIQQKKLSATISIVISNKRESLILEKANAFGLPHVFIDGSLDTREVYDEKIVQQLKSHEVELVILMGYMRIVSKVFIDAFPNKILNIHPSLLPKHAGLMDLAVHEAVLKAGETESGCTVHIVTEHVDQGPIVIQKRITVLRNDTPADLKERVQAIEGEALLKSIKRLIDRKNNIS